MAENVDWWLTDFFSLQAVQRLTAHKKHGKVNHVSIYILLERQVMLKCCTKV